MAERVLFNITEGIIGSLGSHAFQEIGLIWGVRDELQMLQQIVTQVKAVLLDAEQKQANNQVKVWLQSLEDVVYDADDVLDVFYCEAQRRQMVPGKNKISNQVCIFFSSSNQLAFRRKIGRKIKHIKERLNVIASLRTNFHLEERFEETQLITRERETSSFVRVENIIGRDEDKKAVVQLLLDPISKENVSTISIVGLGGLGKTALAQLVFNDEVVQKHFVLKMWICVSDVFELSVIVKKIIESATNKTPDQNLGMERLQKNLREKIDGKRYLLVLDDVWNEDGEKWLSLKDLLMGGAKGSRILITTRSQRVAEVSDTAKPYTLRGLDEQQSWSLFKKMAFKEEKEPENAEIKDIAEEIARKCGGVPLAIRLVGRMLYGKHEEGDWLAFKNNKLSQISQKDNKILPTLKLSYDVLPSHLKHCFAYCSLFPPDYEIDVEELVKLWMAQGFIKSSNQNECLEDIGYGYFKELLWRSFFQEETKGEFGMIISCKMHDLMNELAISVSGTVSTKIDLNKENFDEKCRHVSLNFRVELSTWKIPSSLLKANKIRSFLFLWKAWFSTDETLSELFCNTICLNFKSLRMLSLYGLELTRVPKCLSKMKQLRYLNLRRNKMKRLPNWVVKLQNLQTLDLSHCSSLMELPRDLKNMINLRHLMLTGCDGLTHMPCGLGELMCLRTLNWFALSRRQDKDSAGLGELKKLKELRGQLWISNLRHGKDVSESNVANIMNEKRHLASLTLQWIYEDEVNMDDDEMSLEALQPHSNLKELAVFYYGGVKFASWLSLLNNIVNLELYDLNRCQYLPPLDHLPCLKHLRFQRLSNLEYISDEGWGGSDASSSTSTLPFFPSLEKLILEYCPNLKGWWSPAGRRDRHQSFPRLSTLVINECPRLTSMPLYPSLDKELTLMNTSFKPFQETMMMKMNEDDNHMSTSDAEHSICSSLFLPPRFGFRAASNISSSSSSFSPLSKLKSLQIGISDDKEIQGGVSEGIGKLTSLESLSIENSPNLASLPQGILGGLISLQRFYLSQCPNLASLPEAIGERSSLLKLIINNCPKLTSLPEGIGSLTISECHNLISLPQGIGNLESLHDFKIADCNNFTSFPESIGNLKSLETFQIWILPNLTSLPEGIGNLASLRELTVYNCENLTSLPEGIGNLASLRELRVEFCENLTSLPEGIGNLASLRELRVYNCENLTSLPEGMRRLTSLNTLTLLYCSTLLRKRCKKETGEDWPKIAHIPNLDIWTPIEEDSEPGVGGKILSAFKTLMPCN